MSNNLVSQQLVVSDSQMIEVHVSDKLDFPVSDAQARISGHSPHTVLHEFPVSNGQMGFQEPSGSASVSQNAAFSNSRTGEFDTRLGIQGPQQFLTAHQKFGDMGTLLNNPGPPISSLPTKRKAEVDPMGSLSVSQQSPMPIKRVAQMGIFPHSAASQPSAMIKKGVQIQPKISTPTSQIQTGTRKMVRNDSGKSGPQRVQTPKGRTVQIESTSKSSSESTEAVRSKMRESLASALELACQNQDKSVHEEKSKTESSSSPIPETSLPPESGQEMSGASSDKFPSTQIAFPHHESSSADGSSDGQRQAAGLHGCENLGDPEQGFKDFQCSSMLTTDDFPFTDNFFIKDELLQGNGLSWAWELDMTSRGTCEVESDLERQMVHEDLDGVKDDQVRPSPQYLASEIEEQLFKLFGGVNKKYKEKGRSLLFNLKDRNNPELRERVMSGEISPEKLCSMTAEELASKELSQWRMAKAEEFAQMVVLPDTDVNMRRLVRKTHKGEYQVEVEKDDNVASEVSIGTSSVVLSHPKRKDKEASPKEDDMKGEKNIKIQKSSGENQNITERIVIPSDGTDLMQGMIVDEMKDAEFLPPIVSLDEFMESLDSEPPFESLPVDDVGQTTPLLDKEKKSDASQKLLTSDVPSKDPPGTQSDKSTQVEERANFNVSEKPKQSPEMSKVAPETASAVGCIWQGSLQLNISSSVTVFGVFRSGEKTPTKEWPALLEVKGRVRLDAFEKFLQGLPMSRSRAVMVLHFLLKDNTAEDERANLSEAVESYVSDERVGIAEPAPGVELYLCPPHAKILDMLSKHLLKEHAELLNSSDNGLIGVVVWRRAHLSSSAISPNSSSHHKSSLKRQQLGSRRQHEKDANVNGNTMSIARMTNAQPRPSPQPQDDGGDDDDIPPGFGPAVPRDDDDLPEFNFSGNVNQSVNRIMSHNLSHPPRVASFDPPPSRPVDQMRELVKKYGQNTTPPPPANGGIVGGIGLEPWDDDDDDDIPEWRPQPPGHGLQQPMHMHGGVMHLPVLGQHLPRPLPLHDAMPRQQHAHVAAAWHPSGQTGARFGHLSRPDSSYVSSVGNQHSPGQRYGTTAQTGRGIDRRRGIPRSRAF